MTNLLRLPELMARTGLSKSTIYRKIRTGTFPNSRRINGKTVVWLDSDIEDWIQALPMSDPNDWHHPNGSHSETDSHKAA